MRCNMGESCVSENRPNYEGQVRDPKDLKVGELYEVWGEGGYNGPREIFQVAGKPKKDHIGTRVPIVSFNHQEWGLDTADFIYLGDVSILPYKADRGPIWNTANHLKEHSKTYKICDSGERIEENEIYQIKSKDSGEVEDVVQVVSKKNNVCEIVYLSDKEEDCPHGHMEISEDGDKELEIFAKNK